MELVEELLKYGATIHVTLENFYNYYDLPDYVFKIFIQYGLLEHTTCSSCDNIFNQFPFYVDCKNEVDKMIEENIAGGLTLYDTVSKKCDYGKICLSDQDILFVFQTNSHNFVSKYPIYHDIILYRLETKSYLFKKLYNAPSVFIKIFPNKIIAMNTYCAQKIASYLLMEDLKEFVKALCG